ncbi:MAG: hypothetical protein IJ092_05345 [Atopobiaceae bacterium]|nr:hypothetical protein [Atopobiaceae bacterium]MBQ9317430.1 hypothetical protein [Atopobiaceae bacterium]
METIHDLISAVSALGIPWTNGVWGKGDDGPTVPYVTIKAGDGTSYGADNITWCTVMDYDVELYVHGRDYALERALEQALDDAEIYWSKGVYLLEDESVCETVYSVTVRED